MADLSATQRGVLKGIILGAILSVSTLGLAIAVQPAFWSPAELLMHRVGFALSYDLLLLICLIVAIGALARHRFFTPEDIEGSGRTQATPKAAMLQAILQNTLEQFVVAAMTHVTWAVFMPTEWQGAIPVATVLFVVGRILFAVGYRRGAAARALGFALTFYPTVLMVLAMTLMVLF